MSPADSEDTVVELSRRAVGVRVDSRRVELEAGLRGVDGNRGGSEVDGGLELTLVAGRNVGESGQSRSRVGSGVGASSVLSGVRVGRLGVDTSVGDDVLHGLSHESTVAALVALAPRAVHEVLLRERDELLGAEEVATLGGTSGGEGPARSALLLVLDGSDGTLLRPVPGGGGSSGSERGSLPVLEGVSGHLEAVEVLSELSVGHVSESVHGEGEAVVALVHAVDVLAVLGPDGVTKAHVRGRVGLALSGGPANEGDVVATVAEESGGSTNQTDKENDGFHLFLKNCLKGEEMR